jgi:uncharacterized repeat protein (TIGR01451 family)
MLRKFFSWGIVAGLVFWMGTLLVNTEVVRAALQETITPEPTIVVGAHLSLEKNIENELIGDLNENGVIDPGDTIRYTIVYLNSGEERVTDVVLLDDYDESAITRIENISPSGLDDGSILQWNFDTIAPGERGSVTYDAVIKDVFPADGSVEIPNIAMISSNQTESLTASYSVEVQVPKLGISKTRVIQGDLNSNGQPDPGDTLLYTITVTNLGMVEAYDILLIDDYDEALFNQPLEITLGGVNDGNMIEWHFDESLQPDTQEIVSYGITLKMNFPIGTTLVENTANLSGEGFDNKSAEDTFEIEFQPTLTPTEAPPSATPVPPPLVSGTSEGIEFEGKYLLFMVGFLILAGFIVLVILSSGDILDEENRADVIRDGFIITLVVGAVLTLALAGAIEHSATTGILGTVAGYLLKSGKR